MLFHILLAFRFIARMEISHVKNLVLDLIAFLFTQNAMRYRNNKKF